MELIKKANSNLPRTQLEIDEMIEQASNFYGYFLEALGFDYKADPQTIDTPKRVAKAWMKDLAVGSITEPPKTTCFPNEENYNGIVIQTGIRVNSMCAHHNLPFYGYCSVAYVPGEKVIGLSKINRVTDWFARRPQMQESLTQQIHDYLTKQLDCPSIAVHLSCSHMCCGSRGIKHHNSLMVTNKFSGVFMEKNNMIRDEFLHAIQLNNNK